MHLLVRANIFLSLSGIFQGKDPGCVGNPSTIKILICFWEAGQGSSFQRILYFLKCVQPPCYFCSTLSYYFQYVTVSKGKRVELERGSVG